MCVCVRERESVCVCVCVSECVCVCVCESVIRICPKTFKLDVKSLIKEPQLDPKDLVNYRPISNLPFLLWDYKFIK